MTPGLVLPGRCAIGYACPRSADIANVPGNHFYLAVVTAFIAVILGATIYSNGVGSPKDIIMAVVLSKDFVTFWL